MGKKVNHCWQDKGEYYETLYGFHSEEHMRAAYDEPATCMREAEHDGAHEWMSDDNIGVSFEAAGS